jgi:hypothetical protein
MAQRAAAKVSAPPSPMFLRHASRPTWGVGRVIDVFAGRLRIRFSDGETREFREHVLEAVPVSEVPQELLSLPEPKPAVAAKTRKRAPAKRAPAKRAAK